MTSLLISNFFLWWRRLPALVLALMVAAPLFFLLQLALTSDGDSWHYIMRITMERHLGTTMLLVLGVMMMSLLAGLGSAWLVTLYRFPLRAFLQASLLLPLAVPSYIVAFIYTDLFPQSGIRSVGGAIFVLSLVLYPYVYLFVRSALMEQSSSIFEAGRILGCGAWRNFFKVALPLLRPALAGACALVAMESLSDFGTVQYFALPVFTVGIYDAWMTMFSATAAAQLSLVLLIVVLCVMALEAFGRRARRYHPIGMKSQAVPPKMLRGWRAAAACGFCCVLVLLGFGIPVWFLASHVMMDSHSFLSGDFWIHALNSVTTSFVASLLAALLGFALSWSCLPPAPPVLSAIMRTASVGYAIPGAVLAIGVMMTLAAVPSSSLLLSSVVGLIYGYVVRFMAIPYGLMRASLLRITPQMEDTARTLGHSPLAVVHHVYLPMVQKSFWAAVLFVFVEGMKELPLTLLTRPLNYETLATWIWQYASEERFSEVAHGALVLVLVGMIPVMLINYAINKKESTERLVV